MYTEVEQTPTNSSLRAWPLDWDEHLIRAFGAYFAKKDVNQIAFTQARLLQCQAHCELKTIFGLNGKKYPAWFILLNNGEIYGEIFYIADLIRAPSPIDGVNVSTGEEMQFVLDNVGAIHQTQVLDLIKEVEALIWTDYWKRGDGEGDDTPEPTPDSPHGQEVPPDLVAA